MKVDRMNEEVLVKFTDKDELDRTIDELDTAVEHINWTPNLTNLRDQLTKHRDRMEELGIGS